MKKLNDYKKAKNMTLVFNYNFNLDLGSFAQKLSLTQFSNKIVIICIILIFQLSSFAQVQGIEFLNPEDIPNEDSLTDFAFGTPKVLNSTTNNEDITSKDYIFGGWTPTGIEDQVRSPYCHPKSLEERYLKINGNESLKIETFRDYFDKCGRSLSRYQPTGLNALLKLDKVKYKFFENPQVRPIRLRMSNGEYTDGILALKNDGKRRPFILVKCGLTCKGGVSGTTATFLIHLFDESPFNFLLLGNHTGSNNIIQNQRLVFGGYYEGQEVHEVGKWLRTEAYFRKSISSLHMVGYSLGGHAALYSAIYNDFNPISDDHKVFNSVLAYCPAINLEPTLKNIFSSASPIKGFIREMIWNSIKQSANKVEDLKEFFDPNEKPQPMDFLKGLESATLKFYFRNFPIQRTLFPFEKERVINENKMWELNNFIYQSDGIETPTLVISSQDDDVIEYDLNAKLLLNKYPNPKKGNISILSIPKGNHCAYSITYGWDTMSTILRSFIMGHSSDIYIQRHKTDFNVSFPTPQLWSNEKFVDQQFYAVKNKSYFEFSYRIWGKRWGCKKIFESHESCYRKETTIVPFSQFPKELSKYLKIPKTQTEEQILTRWANTRLDLLTNNVRFGGSEELPNGIRFTHDIFDWDPNEKN